MTSGIIILTALLTFVPALESYRNKKWIDLILVIFFGLALLMLQTYKQNEDVTEQEKKDRKIDTLEINLKIANEKSSTANNLSTLNYQLGQKIESLSNLNISLDSNTQLLASESKSLIAKNIALTKTIPPLTLNVKDLVVKVDDEITGGISIPLIKGYIIGDSTPYNFDDFEARRRDMRIPTGKWILNIVLKNTGLNKLTDLSLTRYHNIGRYRDIKQQEILQCSDALLAYDSANVEIRNLADVLPNTENGRPPYYSLMTFDHDNLFYWIKVKWRKAVYYYYYTIIEGFTITLKDYYEFNGKPYNDGNLLLKDIQEYIKKQSGANGY